MSSTLTRTLEADVTGYITINLGILISGYGYVAAAFKGYEVFASISQVTGGYSINSPAGSTFVSSSGLSSVSVSFTAKIKLTQTATLSGASLSSSYLGTNGWVKKNWSGSEVIAEGPNPVGAAINWTTTAIRIEYNGSDGSAVQTTYHAYGDWVEGALDVAWDANLNYTSVYDSGTATRHGGSATSSIQISAPGWEYGGSGDTNVVSLSDSNGHAAQGTSTCQLSGSSSSTGVVTVVINTASGSPAARIGTVVGSGAVRGTNNVYNRLTIAANLRDLDLSYGLSKTIRWACDEMPAPGYRDFVASGYATDSVSLDQTYNGDIYADETYAVVLWSELHSGGYSQFTNIRAWYPNPTENGEDADDWAPFGFPVGLTDVLRVAHASSYSIPSSSGTIAGGVTFSPSIRTDAYRFLRIHTTGVSGSTIIVSLTGIETKRYQANQVSSGLYEIDLMIPLGIGSGTFSPPDIDTVQSQYPLTSSTGRSASEGDLQGLSYLTSVAFPGSSSGSVTSLELVRKSYAQLSILRPFEFWLTAWPDNVVGMTTTHTTVRPMVLLDVDGRCSDLTGEFHVNISGSGAPSDSWSDPGVSGLVTLLNLIPGLTATDLTPGGYPDNALKWIGCGEGYTPTYGSTCLVDITGSGGKWRGHYGVFGALSVGQGIGDTLTLTQGDPMIYLPCGRRAAYLIGDFSTSGPNAGDTVETTMGGTVRTAATDSMGMGLIKSHPGFALSAPAFVVHGGISTALGTVTLYPRWLNPFRRILLGITSAQGIALAWRRDQFVACAAIISGTVNLQFHYEGRVYGPQIDSGISAFAVALAWAHSQGGQALLCMVTSDGSGVAYRTSQDNGVTWSMATTIASGAHLGYPAIAVGRDGKRFIYWINSSSSPIVEGRIYDAGMAALGGAFTAQSSADNAGLAVIDAFVGQGQEVIEMVHLSSGSVMHTVANDGKTFV